MIKLSNRLNQIVKFVDKEDIILDIGCDHCKLGIYLIQNNIINNMIASDIRNNIITDLIDKLNYLNISDKIDLRHGDGLEVIEERDKINTIIISGLGTKKIIQILDKLYKYKSIDKLIIQSNNNVEKLRKSIINKGFYMEKESIIKEKEKYYITLYFKKGYKKYSNIEKLFGPFFIKNKNELYYKYISELEQNKISLYNNIPKKHVIKRLLIMKEYKGIKKVKNLLFKL